MKAAFVVWKYVDVKGACALSDLTGVEKSYQLTYGVSRQRGFPKKAGFRMDADSPHDTVLIDTLYNTDSVIVASLRLKEFLEAQGLEKVEFLPVTITNHKNKVASKDYFIVHPVDPVECLDITKCGVTYDEIDPEKIDEVKHLVIDESRVEPGRKLFKPKAFADVVLARRELADAIDSEGFSGVGWMETKDYSS